MANVLEYKYKYISWVRVWVLSTFHKKPNKGVRTSNNLSTNFTYNFTFWPLALHIRILVLENAKIIQFYDKISDMKEVKMGNCANRALWSSKFCTFCFTAFTPSVHDRHIVIHSSFRICCYIWLINCFNRASFPSWMLRVPLNSDKMHCSWQCSTDD